MSFRLKLMTAPIGAMVIAVMFGVTPGLAQATQRAAAQGHSSARGGTAPGTILGPAMLSPGTADLACGTGPAGLAEWGIDRIEKSLTLNDNQRNKFNDLKGASEKAVKFLEESCPPNDQVITPTGRLEAMERRLEAMLEAVRTVKPALDELYGTLTDEQKARLNMMDPGSRVATRPASGNVTGRAPRYAQGSVPHYGHHRHWGFRLPFRIRI
jgi:LTXXQ motif family protein